MTQRLLIVDDDPEMSQLIAAGLGPYGFECATRTSAEAGLEALGAHPFDVVLADLELDGGMDGIEMCERIVARHREIPVVVLSAHGTVERTVSGMRAGAFDFVTKPVNFEVLALALERALEHEALRREVQRLRVGTAGRFDDLIGTSPLMRRVYALLEQLKDSDASVLITGESGTGKELAARALHRHSRRSRGPFVAVNCAAVPETLLENELFGHVRGAYTDAREARPGLFVQAGGGTLFLDEIGEMVPSLQSKLLRVLQDKSVRPIGGAAEVPVDVRIVCSTNRDPDLAVAEGRLRKDLLFRVNVIQLELPPLRLRGDDVLMLAQHFVDRFAARIGKRVVGMSAGVAEKLRAHTWPGNVRELVNCIERAITVTTHESLGVADLPDSLRRVRGSRTGRGPAPAASQLATISDVEHRHIVRVLADADGNKTLAARILGLNRRTLHRKLRRYRSEQT